MMCRVFLRGSNYHLEVDDRATLVGFYTDRFLDAPNAHVARELAIGHVWQTLGPEFAAQASTGASATVEECEELAADEEPPECQAGFAWFPEEGEG
jgi:hypothetical protein